MGIGIDIVDVRRIKDPERFADGVLSPRERLIFNDRKDQIAFLAGRFAAKEAFMKAMGRGLGSIALREIEVLYRGLNQGPYISYHDVDYDVSIAHDGDYAVAVVCI
jgi:phosphopantetheine--protein transferase-like protein